MRLDRYLSEMGVETRSRIRELCRAGRVRVNGAAVKKGDVPVEPGKDEITVDGRVISYSRYEYYMLHKPAGVVTAVTDPREKTVMDLLPARRRKDLFPVGRLDKDTEGLLLITNDGGLAKELLSPKKHVPKTYYARVAGRITEEHAEQFRRGVMIGDEKPTLPAELEILSSGDISEVLLTITEGRYHQVKRMFRAVGSTVVYLKRLSMGPLQLEDALPAGEVRSLTGAETEALLGLTGTGKGTEG